MRCPHRAQNPAPLPHIHPLQVRRLAYNLSSNELPHGTAWRAVEEWRAELEAAGGAVQVDLRGLKYNNRLAQDKEAADRKLT